MDAQWQKQKINLNSVIDSNMTDMLRSLQDPAFIFNRQVLQGGYLPTSLRYEKNGWFSGNYGYDFELNSPEALHDSEEQMGDMKVERRNTYASVAYQITSDDESGDINFVYYPLTRVLAYASKTEPDTEWVADENGNLNIIKVHGYTHDFGNEYTFYIDMFNALDGIGNPAVAKADEWVTVDPEDIDFDGDGNPDIETTITFDQRRYVYEYRVYDKDETFTDNFTLHFALPFYIGDEKYEPVINNSKITYGDNHVLDIDYSNPSCIEVTSCDINVSCATALYDSSNQICAVDVCGSIPIEVTDNLTTITEKYIMDLDMQHCIYAGHESIGKSSTATVFQGNETCQVPLVAAGYTCLTTTCYCNADAVMCGNEHTYRQCIQGAVPVWSAQTVYVLRFFGRDIFWNGQYLADSGTALTIVPQQEIHAGACCCIYFCDEGTCKSPYTAYCTVYGNCSFPFDDAVITEHTMSSGGCWYIGSVNQCRCSAGYSQCIDVCIPITYEKTGQTVNTNVCILLDSFNNGRNTQTTGCILKITADPTGFSTGTFDRTCAFAPLPGAIPQFIVQPSFSMSISNCALCGRSALMNCILDCIYAYNKDNGISVKNTLKEASNCIYDFWSCYNYFTGNMQITPVTVVYPVAGWFNSVVTYKGYCNENCIQRCYLDRPTKDAFCIETCFCTNAMAQTTKAQYLCSISTDTEGFQEVEGNFELGGQITICTASGCRGEDGCSSCYCVCTEDGYRVLHYDIGASGKGGDSGENIEVTVKWGNEENQSCTYCLAGGAGGAGGTAGVIAAESYTSFCNCNCRLESFSYIQKDNACICCNQSNAPVEVEGQAGAAGGCGLCYSFNIPRTTSPVCIKITKTKTCGCLGTSSVSGTSCWCSYTVSAAGNPYDGCCVVCTPEVKCDIYGGEGASVCEDYISLSQQAGCRNDNSSITETLWCAECNRFVSTIFDFDAGISCMCSKWQTEPAIYRACGGTSGNCTLEGVSLINSACTLVDICNNVQVLDADYDTTNLQNECNCFGIHLCCNDIKLTNINYCCDCGTYEVCALEFIPQLSDGFIYITNSASAYPAWATSKALTCREYWNCNLAQTTTELVGTYNACTSQESSTCTLNAVYTKGAVFQIQTSDGCAGSGTTRGGSSGYSVCITYTDFTESPAATCCVIIPGGAGGGAGGAGAKHWIVWPFAYDYGDNGSPGAGTAGQNVVIDLTNRCICDISFTFCCATACALEPPFGYIRTGADAPFIDCCAPSYWCDTMYGGTGGNGGYNGQHGAAGGCTKKAPGTAVLSSKAASVTVCKVVQMTGANPWSVSNETAQATKLGNTSGLYPQLYVPVNFDYVNRLQDVTVATTHDSYHNLETLQHMCATDTTISFTDSNGIVQQGAAKWTRDSGVCCGALIDPVVTVHHGNGTYNNDYTTKFCIACSSLSETICDTSDHIMSTIDMNNFVCLDSTYCECVCCFCPAITPSELGNYTGFDTAIPGFATNCATTCFDVTAESFNTNTEPYMLVHWCGNYPFCTVIPVAHIDNCCESELSRSGCVFSYTQGIYKIIYNDFDVISVNVNQQNVESSIYTANIDCFIPQVVNCTGKACITVCGADFDYATFTLAGVYKNKGTEPLVLKDIDSTALTLKYADNDTNTTITVRDIIDNKTFLDITATDVNKSVHDAEGDDATSETKIAAIELNSEYQLVKQQWDSTIETENMWWLDSDHIMLLTRDYFVIKEKEYNSVTGEAKLDDWNGDQWKEKQKISRAKIIDTTVTAFDMSSVYGDTALNNGGVYFYTINILNTKQFRLNIYSPLNDMQKVHTQVFNVEELNYGQPLSEEKNVLSMYTFMDAETIISHAKISATHAGYKFIFGIHVDNSLRQWSFMFHTATWELRAKITGYGYVGANGTLTGGQFPSYHVDAQKGFFGTVNFVNDLADYSNKSIDGDFTMKGIYGTQEQQWYIYKEIPKICSHIQFAEAADSKNGPDNTGTSLVCKWLPLKSTYSAKYSSTSFLLNRLTGFMPEPTTLGSIFDFGNNSINTLINVLTAIASPSVWFLNICWTKFGFLNQAVGQFAYTYRNTDKDISVDKNLLDSYRDAQETQPADARMKAFEQNSAVLTHDTLSFDKQEMEQTCTTKSSSNGGITNFWLCLLQAGISGLNNSSIANSPIVNKALNEENAGRTLTQFAMENALDATSTDLGVQRATDVILASKVTAVKTLDMFYSTSSNSLMYAGPGYVCHNFIGYCVAQSMSNRFLSGSQSTMFTALDILSNLSFRLRTVILKALDDLFDNLADSNKDGNTTVMGTGTVWGVIASSLIYAGKFVTTQLIKMNEFFLEAMPEILRAICPGYPNAQFAAPGSMSSHDINIEAKHNYGSKHVTFMYPCFGCESTYFTKESVDAVIKDSKVKVDFTPQNSLMSTGKGLINLYTSDVENVTDSSNAAFKQSLYDDIHTHFIYAQGKSEIDNVPPDTAVVEGATTFLPTVPFKNENIDVTMVFPTAPVQDYMVDDMWNIGLTANQGGVLWVSVKDTKLLDGDYSNIVITDDTALIASPYTVVELKKQIEKEYIRPVAVTPNALAWNMTGLNVSYDGKMYHGFDGIGYRLVHWAGTSGMGTEDLTLEYCFRENNHFKRSNILMPNHFFGNFTSLPVVSADVDSRDGLYHQIEIDTKGIGIENLTSAENKNLARYAAPVFTEQLSTMPSVVKTLSSYRLNVIQGVTSLTTDIRITQNKYKIPKAVDFNINKNLYRATDEYVNALNESGLSVGDLTSKLGLEFIGATPTQAFFYSDATRSYYSFTGNAMIQKQDVWNRFKDIKDGKWDFVNQNVVFQCIGNMTRVMDDVSDRDDDLVDNIFIATMDGQQHGITGEVTPPGTPVFNNKSWFKTYSFAGGLTFQGPNRYVVNRFICLDYMIDDIIANKGKWKKLKRDKFNPFRKYDEEFKSVDNRIGDDYLYTEAATFAEDAVYYYNTGDAENPVWKRAYGLDAGTFAEGTYYTRKLAKSVEGWTHNPFVLATAPLGVSEETDCLFEWELTFTWTDEMDRIYKDNEYACVNIMAQTMCPGGKKRCEPTHLYLHKDLFTRSENTGYYSFKFASRNGAGNREQLFIWSDAYIAMTGLSVNYKVITERRTMPLTTSQVDIREMKEF